MATELSRLEFKQSYGTYNQGLFIFKDGKRLPKGQVSLNVGDKLSEALLSVPMEWRKNSVLPELSREMGDASAITLERIDVLFTPYLELDVLGSLASQCRNRKVCIVWPGLIENGKVYYASPGEPEYYECDLTRFQETYIIKD